MQNRFNGDGRVSLEALPGDSPAGATPLKVRRAICRTIVALFDEKGVSHHSAMGGTVWISVEHCRVNNIPYKIEHSAGSGWVVRRVKG